MNVSCGGGVTEIMEMPNDNNPNNPYEKAAINYARDNNHRVEFLVANNDETRCIIAELEFASSSIRDSVFADDDIVKFSKMINRKNTDFILSKEKVGNNKIKYSLAPESAQLIKPDYILDIDSDEIGSEFNVKIYEETYVYAPHGGITYKDMVFVNNAITYTDYKAVYLDEASFKELSHYDTLIEDKCDIGLANNMAASGIIYLMKNSEFEKYEA